MYPIDSFLNDVALHYQTTHQVKFSIIKKKLCSLGKYMSMFAIQNLRVQ